MNSTCSSDNVYTSKNRIRRQLHSNDQYYISFAHVNVIAIVVYSVFVNNSRNSFLVIVRVLVPSNVPMVSAKRTYETANARSHFRRVSQFCELCYTSNLTETENIVTEVKQSMFQLCNQMYPHACWFSAEVFPTEPANKQTSSL